MVRCYILLLVFVIIGCQADTDSTPPSAIPPALPTASLAPTLTTQQRLNYETQYEALRQSQQTIERVWRDLQANREVSCADDILQPITPSNIIGTDHIGQLLFKAATEVNDAIILWRAECQNPRTMPLSSVIDEGLRHTLTAAQTLSNIQQELQR